MREKIKKILVKYPLLFSLAQKIWWQFSSLKVKFYGTSYIEKYWRNKKFSNFYNINHSHRVSLIEKISSYQPFSNVLEVGCDYGPNLYLLAIKFPKSMFTGIDTNPQAIESGRELTKKESIKNIKLIVGSVDELKELSEKSFDIVFTDAVLMYIGPDKIKDTMKEINRLAKKAIVLVEWNIKDKKDEYDAHVGVWRRDYVRLLKETIPQKEIILTKITREIWPDKNWQKWGYIIEVKL